MTWIYSKTVGATVGLSSSDHRRPTQAGLTLLEIVLALAILAGALVTLAQLIRIGSHAATGARDMTQAQLLCQSKLAEVASGVVEAEVTPLTPFELDPGWLYAINLERIDEQGLLAVQVTVVEDAPDGRQPESFSLIRWMPDSGMELPEDATLNPTAETSQATDPSAEGSP